MSSIRQHDEFASTHWSLVLAAAGQGAAARSALESLCQSYWQPVYIYYRRRSADAAAAADLTQAFFTHLLETNALRHAEPSRGRFRAFLLTAAKNFMANERRKRQAAKRGGGARMYSFDFEAAESSYACEPADNLTPERLFERRWAVALLDRALERLQQEWTTAGKSSTFSQLRPFLAVEGARIPYVEISQSLGVSEPAARAAVYRLRKRYRALLRDEVAQTASSDEEVEEELKWLFRTLSA